MLLALDANDTPVAVTGSTSCAVSVPTTHDTNREASCYVAELLNKKVGKLIIDYQGRPSRSCFAAGWCAMKVSGELELRSWRGWSGKVSVT